ncbi:transketolase [Filomicrobium insigne]|uniref:Transketolase n=1 Tax=Filomicrobium insigne TaxID=418854 RepID=A0A1H0R8Z3_9HYPH|nr:transketolase [Filomicrobium insigne]SDP25895.1 transketolase [Filomicrobium insigne]
MNEAQTRTGATEAVSHADMANAIRALSMDAVQAAKSGHPGMPMGMADVATVLYRDVLRFSANAPDWPNRDRFVLSAGHGSMLLYSLLYLTGYPGMTIEEIKNFRQWGSNTAGHPEYGHAAGIETTTGPLGQGIANAVGMALSERLLNARAGNDLINHHIYCIAGDGCLMEGISQEAISLAGHLRLGKLIVLFDDNGISIDGSTSLAVSDDQVARFAASGWNTMRIDGHDPEAISKALAAARADSSKPWLIACRTVIGYGSPARAGTAKAHGEPLGPDEITATREKLGWPYQPFEVPEDVLNAWRALGAAHKGEVEAWDKRVASASSDVQALFAKPVAEPRAKALAAAVTAAKTQFAADESQKATRVWSQLTLEHLVPALPELIGGSADLTGSNGTRTSHHKSVTPDDFSANYIHYGVREHGMAAAMNGLALSGSIIPYGATFLVFTDYCRPSIRLSALMHQRVIYVMTHDSIGLGEDGPTHQPVEHLSALRAIPNLHVMRPADGVETAECWELAIGATKTPTILALSRQGVPRLRTDASSVNRCAKGAYVLNEAEGARDVTLIATGTEVGLARSAAKQLAERGIKAAVVSMPSMELFRAQDDAYREETLGAAPRIAIEAAIAQSWYEWLRPGDRFVGLKDFGASAPAGELYKQFGLTADHIAGIATELVK